MLALGRYVPIMRVSFSRGASLKNSGKKLPKGLAKYGVGCIIRLPLIEKGKQDLASCGYLTTKSSNTCGHLLCSFV